MGRVRDGRRNLRGGASRYLAERVLGLTTDLSAALGINVSWKNCCLLSKPHKNSCSRQRHRTGRSKANQLSGWKKEPVAKGQVFCPRMANALHAAGLDHPEGGILRQTSERHTHPSVERERAAFYSATFSRPFVNSAFWRWLKQGRFSHRSDGVVQRAHYFRLSERTRWSSYFWGES